MNYDESYRPAINWHMRNAYAMAKDGKSIEAECLIEARSTCYEWSVWFMPPGRGRTSEKGQCATYAEALAAVETSVRGGP